MDMTGEQVIAAPRQRVWEALNDPEMLKKAIPGCQTVEKISDTEFTATVVAKVGPVSATFKGKVTLSALRPGQGYTISGEGQGGAAGFGKGGAEVSLEDAPGGGTTLRYTAHASVGGKLAQIGSRLIDGAARKMADDFFARFGELMAATNPAPAPAPAPTQSQSQSSPPPPAVVAPAAVAPAPAAAAAAHGEAGLPGWVFFAGVMIVVWVLILAIAMTPS